MIIDLTELNLKNEILIDEKLSFTKEDLKNTELIDLQNVIVKGIIYKDELNEYNISVEVKGTMILPCSLSLEPTEYTFSTKIEENLEENEEKYKKSQKTIDILPIIWENILMEIPMKIINEKAKNMKTKGDGWELITDSETKGNNSLAKLKDLL